MGAERGLRLRAYGALGIIAAAGIGLAAVAPDLIGVAGGVGVAGSGGLWVGHALDSAVGKLGPSDALEDLSNAVAEALRATGGTPETLGSNSVRLVVQQEGYYRCLLDGTTSEQTALFAQSMDELLSSLAAPRYIIPRYVIELPASVIKTAWLVLRLSAGKKTSSTVVYHAVPAWLAANKERATKFAGSWNRYVSAGEPLYWKDPQAQAIVADQRGEDPVDVTRQMSALWR